MTTEDTPPNPWEEDVDKKLPQPMAHTELTLGDDVQAMVDEVIRELAAVHDGKYDVDRAKKTAALALQAQIRLAEFISDCEFRAKGLKHSIKVVEADVDYEIRSASSANKKLTDKAVLALVTRDSRVGVAENTALASEREFRRWSYVFATLKEAHIFFRGLGNGKNEWSL